MAIKFKDEWRQQFSSKILDVNKIKLLCECSWIQIRDVNTTTDRQLSDFRNQQDDSHKLSKGVNAGYEDWTKSVYLF